jgi:phosphoribosyl-AMP cyclohydrolase
MRPASLRHRAERSPEENPMAFIDGLKFNADGLIPAISQDAATGEVLMMAWMNREAVEKTVEKGLAHYYSRSRQKQWLKGEESGHVQKVVEMRTDCDGDTLLLKVNQSGGACHTGYRSCFYKLRTADGVLREDGVKAFDPAKVYKKK